MKDSIYQKVAGLAQQKKEQVILLRRDFHAHPELSLKEFRTTQKIEEELDRLGIEHFKVSETGVIGVLKGKAKEKDQVGDHAVIALRADVDALPICEKNETDYKSQADGVMHACGHDSHTAMLLGAASVLKEMEGDFSGTVRFLFQPAEEIGAGGKIFRKEKERTLADAQRVFGIHCAPDLQSGLIGVTPGINNASVDHFTIRVQGKSAHVCTPEKGVDALYIGSQIVAALQGIVSRETSPVEPVVIGVGRFEAGSAYNIIAESAELEGTTRNVSKENREKVNRLVTETAKSIAALYGGSAEVEWEDFALPLINPAQICQEVSQVVDLTLGEGHVKSDRVVSLSGDDFSEYQEEVPGVYAYLGVGNPKVPGTQNALHTVNFGIDEDALTLGVSAYAAYTLWWLNEGYANLPRQ